MQYDYVAPTCFMLWSLTLQAYVFWVFKVERAKDCDVNILYAS